MRPRSLASASRTAILGTVACGIAAAGVPSVLASPASATAAPAPLLTGQLLFFYSPTLAPTTPPLPTLANADGSGLQTITPSGGGLAAGVTFSQAQISPDGKHLSFVVTDNVHTGSRLFVADPDGSNAAQVPVPVGIGHTVSVDGYQWSPDSAWLYVADGYNGSTWTSEIHPDGTGIQQFGPAAMGGPLSVADRSGEVGWPSGSTYDIYNPATNQTRTVALAPWASSMSLSPDGKFLAVIETGSGHPTQLVVQPTDGSPSWVAQPNAIYNNGYIPSWSPDESKIAFLTHVKPAGGTFTDLSYLSVGSSSGNGPAPTPVPSFSASGPTGYSSIGTWVPLPAGTPLQPPTAGAAPGNSRPVATRIGGGDRVDTAIKVAEAGFGPGGKQAKVAVLSRSDGYADALAGNALAAQKGGPLLLTGSAGLDPRVKTELSTRLPAGSTVYVLGGPKALSPQVEADLRALNLVPARLQGLTRYDTAVAVAHEVSQHPHTVLVATGDDFPDALAAGAAAATDPGGGVVLLSSGGTVSGQTQTYLAAIDPATTAVYGVGGQGVAALNTVPTLKSHFTPLAGSDRYATDFAVASNTTLYPAAPTTVGVATAVNWPDALAGGAFVGAAHAPLLLTGQYVPGAAATPWLAGHGGTLTSLSIFGGTNVVSTDIATQVGNTAWGAGKWDLHVMP